LEGTTFAVAGDCGFIRSDFCVHSNNRVYCQAALIVRRGLFNRLQVLEFDPFVKGELTSHAPIPENAHQHIVNTAHFNHTVRFLQICMVEKLHSPARYVQFIPD
jgi:hypothetical protein